MCANFGTIGCFGCQWAEFGVDDDDAEYYSPRMKDGAVFMSVDDEKSGYDPDRTSEVMYNAGGHNRMRPRT